MKNNPVQGFSTETCLCAKYRNAIEERALTRKITSNQRW